VPVGDVSGEPVLGLRRKPEKSDVKNPPFACLEADVVVVPICGVAVVNAVGAEMGGEEGAVRLGDSNMGRTTVTGATAGAGTGAGDGMRCVATDDPLLTVAAGIVVVM
jgi:hypothetical protein